MTYCKHVLKERPVSKTEYVYAKCKNEEVIGAEQVDERRSSSKEKMMHFHPCEWTILDDFEH